MIEFAGNYWKELVGWSIGLLAIFSTAAWRYKLWDENRIKKNTDAAKAKEKLALQIKDLQKDMSKLDQDMTKLRDGAKTLEVEVYKSARVSAYAAGMAKASEKE